MRISDWSSDVCSADLHAPSRICPSTRCRPAKLAGHDEFPRRNFRPKTGVPESITGAKNLALSRFNTDGVAHDAAVGFYGKMTPGLFGQPLLKLMVCVGNGRGSAHEIGRASGGVRR